MQEGDKAESGPMSVLSVVLTAMAAFLTLCATVAYALGFSTPRALIAKNVSDIAALYSDVAVLQEDHAADMTANAVTQQELSDIKDGLNRVLNVLGQPKIGQEK